MERHFEEELRDLKGKILYMGSVVEKMIERSTAGLFQDEYDETLFGNIWKLEEEINHLHIELDETCIKLIALRQPAAVDLRFITSVMKINSELERIGDQAINIMQNITLYLKEQRITPLPTCPHSHPPSHFPSDKFTKMVDLVREMLHNVLDSFVHKDIELSKSVLVRDSEVDQLKREILEGLIKSMLDSPEIIKSAIELILIARNLERIGDHSTNIAEDVIFSVVGKDVRHHITEIG